MCGAATSPTYPAASGQLLGLTPIDARIAPYLNRMGLKLDLLDAYLGQQLTLIPGG